MGCELVQGDLTDAGSLERAVEGVEGVVHLVAIRQGKEEQFERIMTGGTAGLVLAARQAGVGRFVHIERPRRERGDEGSRALLPGEMGDGADRSGLRDALWHPAAGATRRRGAPIAARRPSPPCPTGSRRASCGRAFRGSVSAKKWRPPTSMSTETAISQPGDGASSAASSPTDRCTEDARAGRVKKRAISSNSFTGGL